MPRLLLAIILFEIPLQLDAYLFGRPDDITFGAIAGLNVSLTTFCLALLYTLWIPGVVRASKFPNRRRLKFNVPLTCYVCLAGFSFLVAGDKELAVFELFLMVQAYLLYFYLANTLTDRRDVFFVISMILAAFLLQSVMALYVIYLRGGVDVILGSIVFRVDLDGRAAGSLGSPIVAASYCALLLAPAAAIFMMPTPRYTKLVAACAFFLGWTLLILTESRAAWVAGLFSCATVSVYGLRRRILSLWVLAPAGALCVLLGTAYAGNVANRLTADDKGSAVSRIGLLQLGLAVAADHPLGVGSNNFAAAAQEYRGQLSFREQWFFTVHNKYLLIAAETGVASLVAYVCFLLFTIRQGWLASKGSDPMLAPLALALTAAVIGQMLHMLVDVFNSRP